MRINLHSLYLAPAVLAAAAFTAQPALAAATAKVHVPFDFVASGMTLSAGDYTVHQNKQMSLVGLEGPANTISWSAGPGDPGPSDQRVVLTFDKIGESHVLRTVQFGSKITNRLDKKYMHTLAAEEQITGGQ